jgi:hypothetical protein
MIVQGKYGLPSFSCMVDQKVELPRTRMTAENTIALVDCENAAP